MTNPQPVVCRDGRLLFDPAPGNPHPVGRIPYLVSLITVITTEHQLMIKSVKAFFAGAGIGPSCELFGLAQI